MLGQTATFPSLVPQPYLRMSSAQSVPVEQSPPQQSKPALTVAALPQTCAFIEVRDLYTRKGAAVSVNVRYQHIQQEEAFLGEVIFVGHKAKKSHAGAATAKMDEAIVKQLLLKVQESEPLARKEWDDDAGSWYIFAPAAGRKKAIKKK